MRTGSAPGQVGVRVLASGFRMALATWMVPALPAALTAAEGSNTATQGVVTVFAASSASDCLNAIARTYEAARKVTVRLNLASSSVLARQIDQGARCDVFLSADIEWMDYLAQRTNIQAATRQNLLGNRLVIVTPANRPLAVKMDRSFDLPKSFAGRLAVGDPDHVPAGKYAKEALQNMGWWDGLKDRLAPAENVRAALLLVERGETDAGIVYATDARASKAVTVAAEFPEDSHKPIRYPAALCVGAGAEARAFLDYLTGKEAAAVWTAAGFAVLQH
jgi:molybdate transport system substrate-binding protein